MVDSDSANGPDFQRTRVVEVIGDGALRFHVRDEEASVRRMPTCVLSPLARDRCTRVDVAICPLRLWLPDVLSAETMDVPEDGRWQGWQWARFDYLLLCIYRDPDLPRLAGLTVPRAGYWHLEIAGRPMRVWRAAPEDPGWPVPGYLAEVRGFLDDTTEFTAQAVALTESRREELLAAVATLEHLPPAA